MADSIIISAPRQGISSPMVGFADCRNLDISSIPGIVKLNKKLTAVTGTIANRINRAIVHPITSTEVYALSNAGIVYKSTDSGLNFTAMTGNTQTSCHGNGLAIFANYLVVARDAFIDVCGDGTATGIGNGAWTNGWKAIDSDVLWHPMLISKNDSKLYGGAGRFDFSLEELTTFVPATANTYTWTQQALDLPAPNRIKCIEEHGNNIMNGIWQGSAVNAVRAATIYPWDRSSVSFGQPINLNDFGVHAMLNDGGTLIVLAGISGQIRECNGASAWAIGQIPNSLIDLTGKYLEFYPGALCKYKGKYFFGVGYTAALGGMGVYSLERTGRGNILNFEHTVSSGNDGTTNLMQVSALLPITDEKILVGYLDNATAGLDLTDAAAYSTDYSGYFTTPLYVVGTNLNQKKITELEWALDRLLRTGEGIKIQYRTNLTASFSDGLVREWLFSDADVGAVVSRNIITELPNDIKAAEMIQLKVMLKGTATTTPEARQIILK